MTGICYRPCGRYPEAEKGGRRNLPGCMCRKRHRGWRTAAVGETLWAIYSKLSIISGMMPISNTIRIRILAGARIWVSKGTYNPKTSVKEDNWGTSFILNRYSSIYGGFRGSNLPYYESWIESFKVEPSKRVDATGVWNKGDYSYTLGGNGEITFYPEVKALEDEPSSWFLHFTTDEKSPSLLL